MNSIKDYLERIDAENWDYLGKTQPSFIEKMDGNEITTDALNELIEADIKLTSKDK